GDASERDPRRHVLRQRPPPLHEPHRSVRRALAHPPTGRRLRDAEPGIARARGRAAGRRREARRLPLDRARRAAGRPQAGALSRGRVVVRHRLAARRPGARRAPADAHGRPGDGRNEGRTVAGDRLAAGSARDAGRDDDPERRARIEGGRDDAEGPARRGERLRRVQDVAVERLPEPERPAVPSVKVTEQQQLHEREVERSYVGTPHEVATAVPGPRTVYRATIAVSVAVPTPETSVVVDLSAAALVGTFGPRDSVLSGGAFAQLGGVVVVTVPEPREVRLVSFKSGNPFNGATVQLFRLDESTVA